MTTAAERKKSERERKRALGLRPHEIWCLPDDWPEIQKVIERKNKKRLDKN